MVIFTLSFRETKADGFEKHDFTERFKTAYDNSWTISVQGIFNSLPLIIFSYMYQPNIPAIYHELKSKNMMNMQKVLWIGTGIGTVVYILVGMFGYVTFAMNPKVDEIMDQQNILQADYGDNNTIKVCLLLMLMVVLFASPFCVLPAKDSIEELIMGESRKKFNTQ
jgi:amino acid permease